MTHHLFYWKPETVRNTPDSVPLWYSASEQFSHLIPGDVVWMVTSEGPRALSLIGRLAVSRLTDSRAEAQDWTGREDLWEARWYLLAQKEHARPKQDIDIGHIANALRFDGRPDRLPANFSGQHLQSMRRVTSETVELLEKAWQSPTTERTSRNPPWHRDELVLALDLYERLSRKVPDDKHPEVIALSELLNSLPIHEGRPDATRFRNSNGVALKLANFRAIEQPGKGMSRGNRLERELWDEFAGNRPLLAAEAARIRTGQATVRPVQYVSAPKQIRASVEAFNREAVSNPARAMKLLRGTTYWVYEPDSGVFGPGKFVGLAEMTLDRYESARHESNGGKTHEAIETVLDDQFLDHDEWHPLLLAWGEQLLGDEAFGNAEASKWRFVSLRPHAASGAGTTTSSRGRRGTTDVGAGETVTYVLRQIERQATPFHRRYQGRLKEWLENRSVRPEFEKNFIDVRFSLDGVEFVGEVKLTTNLSRDDAFRTALGQVLFYACVKCDSSPQMMILLDHEPPEKCLALASRLDVSVVAEVEGQFRLLTPHLAPALASLFVTNVPAGTA